jgi:hypothetical protein
MDDYLEPGSLTWIQAMELRRVLHPLNPFFWLPAALEKPPAGVGS